MITIKKHIGQGFAGGELYDILKQLQQLGIGIGGEVYFVDANAGSDGADDGKSWERPYKTLSYAITASNANIAADHHGWASRNTILCKGDKIQEDLTTAPSKCDVIGVGSNDAENKTHIEGKQIFTQSGTNMSMGWYNLTFSNDAAEAIFTITTPGGVYFGDCDFVARSDAIHTIHLKGTTGHDFIVDNCRIMNDEYADKFATGGILNAVTTTFWNFLIKNSYVEGEYGITIDTTNLYNGLIDNNIIRATGKVIVDTSDDCLITRNRCFTAADAATITTAITYNSVLACDNLVTGDGETLAAPVIIWGTQS